MTDTTILLIRHGHTPAVGAYLAGRTDVPLTAVGEQQADALAVHLADTPLAAVYSSPRLRTRQTAIPIAAVHNLDVVIQPDLDEVDDGEWTGRTFDELAADVRWRRFNERRTSMQIPGGEWMAEVQARAVSALHAMRLAHPQATIAAVTHGDVIRAAVAFFLGIDLDALDRFDVSPASITPVRLSEHGATVQRVNDLSAVDALSRPVLR
jgi:probable phosphoglycerate mutase